MQKLAAVEAQQTSLLLLPAAHLPSRLQAMNYWTPACLVSVGSARQGGSWGSRVGLLQDGQPAAARVSQTLGSNWQLEA